MKTVYFAQHGMAHPKDVDPQRPLSDLGSAEVRRVATYLREHKIVIRKICHSGKLRALQTATIFSQILGVGYVSELSGMNPNDNPAELIEQITEDAVLYVGHLPHIANVITNIITADGNNTVLKFQNSAVACIEMDKSTASIKWFIIPSIC